MVGAEDEDMGRIRVTDDFLCNSKEPELNPSYALRYPLHCTSVRHTQAIMLNPTMHRRYQIDW